MCCDIGFFFAFRRADRLFLSSVGIPSIPANTWAAFAKPPLARFVSPIFTFHRSIELGSGLWIECVHSRALGHSQSNPGRSERTATASSIGFTVGQNSCSVCSTWFARPVAASVEQIKAEPCGRWITLWASPPSLCLAKSLEQLSRLREPKEKLQSGQDGSGVTARRPSQPRLYSQLAVDFGHLDWQQLAH